MKFPNKKYKSVKDYKKDYYSFLKISFDSINDHKLDKVIQILDRAYRNPKRKILVCGNGGSAALANHFACDHQKILNETKNQTIFNKFVNKFCSYAAISNDEKYENVYGDQINQIGLKNDILITISSSVVQNIVKTIMAAKKNLL